MAEQTHAGRLPPFCTTITQSRSSLQPHHHHRLRAGQSMLSGTIAPAGKPRGHDAP
ncbi:hypothetical protein JB92DRAFT_3003801 [Gautieria morchelliformis]|nr:hypothetical protein JB92DRAFT_3003801 [Gautieria morchelliformis]